MSGMRKKSGATAPVKGKGELRFVRQQERLKLLHHLHRALRQGAEEAVAVVLGEDARVGDDDDAFVLLGAHSWIARSGM